MTSSELATAPASDDPQVPLASRRRAWSLALALLAATGLASGWLTGMADLGDLLILALVLGYAVSQRRPTWITPVLATVGLLGELREGAGAETAVVGIFVTLVVLGVSEAWLRRDETGGGPGSPDFVARARAGTLAPDLVGAAGMLVVALVPLWLVLAAGVPARVVAFGALSWVAGVVAVKSPLFHLVLERRISRGARPAAVAAANGVLSAIGELGMAAAVLVIFLPDLGAAGAIGFGIGPAALEAVLTALAAVFGWRLLGDTSLQAGGEEIEAAVLARWPRCARMLLPVIERALTVPIHVGSRMLVWAALDGRPAAAILAVSVFAATDGWATYILLRSGRPLHRLWSAAAVTASAAVVAGVGAWLLI